LPNSYAGKLEQVFETTTAGITVQSPQLDINTVAAGGGSILTWEAGMFKVGPDSASAHPGPACYRKGGPLTVTDANLVLGRLRPEFFPKIFGPNEDLPLDLDTSRRLFEEITKKINEETNMDLTLEDVATGYASSHPRVMTFANKNIDSSTSEMRPCAVPSAVCNTQSSCLYLLWQCSASFSLGMRPKSRACSLPWYIDY
jgi:N-methylhydantoinase A/oxoprolinase/acetone carboxylase beta subunit